MDAPDPEYTPPVPRPSHSATWLFLGLATACANSPAGTAHAPPAASENAAAAAPIESAPAAPIESAAPAPSASDEADLPSLDAPPPATSAAGFDFGVWCTDHKVEANLEVDGCEPAKLGKKPDDMLWCRRHVTEKSGVVLYYQGLYLPRGKKVEKTWETVVGVGSLDLPANPAKDIERYLVKLDVTAGDDHKSVTIADSAGRSCDKALAANADKYSRDKQAGKPERDAIEKTCRARGHYSSSTSGRLRRTSR